MEFDKSKIYTPINAEEAKIGSKGYFENTLKKLKSVFKESENLRTLIEVGDEDSTYRFVDSKGFCRQFFYLVSEPEEPKEVTADKWDNTPRIMKVWDGDDFCKAKEARVMCIIPKEFNVLYPVITVPSNGNLGCVNYYEHCAEIDTSPQPKLEETLDKEQELDGVKIQRTYENYESFMSNLTAVKVGDRVRIPTFRVPARRS